MIPSPNCLHCSNPFVETHRHLWWECHAWDSLRHRCIPFIHFDSTWPACFFCCGIMTVPLYPTEHERASVAVAVQSMMVAILLAKTNRERTIPLSGSVSSTRGYPWGWSPRGHHEHFGQQLKLMVPPSSWKYGPPFFAAITHYVCLAWPLTRCRSRGRPWSDVCGACYRF